MIGLLIRSPLFLFTYVLYKYMSRENYLFRLNYKVEYMINDNQNYRRRTRTEVDNVCLSYSCRRRLRTNDKGFHMDLGNLGCYTFYNLKCKYEL